MKHLNRSLVTGVGALLISLTPVSTYAGALGFWATDGWTAMTLDSHGGDGVVGPGVGGQQFDAEFLYYKQSGNLLSIGLQAGFNLITGYESHSSSPNDYYSGDLALSFDGSAGSSGYEYAVDFGLMTKDYDLNTVDMGTTTTPGEDLAGLYSVNPVSGWNNDVYSGHSSANPFAADVGTLLQGLTLGVDMFTGSGAGTGSGTGDAGNQTSYYRTVTFDIGSLGLSGPITLDAHWTMSCGNDYINGTTTLSSVPEPSTMALMFMSLMGIGWAGRRKRAAA